ncbi:S8 family serine peptidase, partial [Intestinibacter sp.]|uniref:S8 family serine peptidase n=1 Tax=Intestinibacter sp. TaxID=1965304 RepID=UPI002A763A26
MDYTKIGILDNSVDENHEDLKFEKVWNSKTSSSDNEHATNIAGIIGAKFNNGKGISGMCPKAILYAYDSKRDKYTSDIGIKCGLSKLILNDVKVINCSFGYTELVIASSLLNRNIITNQNAIKTIENNLNYFKITYTDFFNKFIEEGYDFLIVHAAGNGNFYYYRIAENLDEHNYGIEISTKEKPGFTKCENITAENDIFSNITDKAIKDRIIVVGASGQDGKGENYKLSYLSNVGDRVDVLAPGENIYSTFPNNKYDSEKIGGTSCAAPYVTGLAGMIWGINKDLPASMVKNIIISSANIDVNNTDKNMINANIAVKLAKIRKEKIDNYNSEKGMVFLKIKDTSSDNIDDASVIIKDENGNVVDTVNSNETGEVYAFLGSGTYNLLFEKEGYESFLLEDVEIKKDDVLYKNILMRKASNVSGKVVDNVGNSLKNVNLTFKTSNSDNIAVKTDESGSFSKKIAYGTYTLIISKDGYETKQINIEVNDSQKDLGQITLEKEELASIDNNYLGQWSYEDSGKYVDLQIDSLDKNNISFSISSVRKFNLTIAESMEDTLNATLDGNKINFTCKDGWDNSIKGTIEFKGENVYLQCDVLEYGSTARWSIGTDKIKMEK